MRTVSTKETPVHSSRCNSCHLWFRFVHLSADGRFLCGVCLALNCQESAVRAW